MTRSLFAGLALALAPALPAFAALPPYADRIEQITTIISSEALAERLNGSPINSLDFEGIGAGGAIRWEVDSEGCDVDIWLEPQPMPEGMVGKVTYLLRTPVEQCD